MRSVPADSFERLTSALSLWRAWHRHARHKLRRPTVAAFHLNADRHVLALHRRLRDGTYTPGAHYQHVIREPKTRLISAPSLIDRVVHQAVVHELGPYYERSYIAQSYACRPGLGPHRAVLRYLGWTRRCAYRLSLDIRRYFMSIDHETLLSLIARRLRDLRALDLVRQLVMAGGAVYRTPLAVRTLGLDKEPISPGVGLPIGSCLSQWAANLYLDGLDHLVKRTLKIRCYLRYMDDFTLFAPERRTLEHARGAIVEWLRDERRLALNPKRWHVHPASQPSTYLGYRVSPSGLTLGRKTRKRMPEKLRKAARHSPERLERCVASYRALAVFG